MAIKDAVTRRIFEHAASDKKVGGMSWQQAVDFACSMLGITARHIQIESSRGVVHVSYTQLGKQHLLDVPFHDIARAVNGPAGEAATDPHEPAHVTIGRFASGAGSGLATSPPYPHLKEFPQKVTAE